ncbi:hypothetical protein MTO96_014594 [Rhipicephalus appendiculatus]
MGRKTDVSQFGSPSSRHDVLVDVPPLRRTSRPTQQYGTATPEDQGQATTHEDRTRITVHRLLVACCKVSVVNKAPIKQPIITHRTV